jgi:WhiB family redox-sensing transcriptional regulator
MTWQQKGACRRHDPDLFFVPGDDYEAPASRAQVVEAKAVCFACPVQTQCLAWALETGQCHGIWGGLTPPERRALRRTPGPGARLSRRCPPPPTPGGGVFPSLNHPRRAGATSAIGPPTTSDTPTPPACCTSGYACVRGSGARYKPRHVTALFGGRTRRHSHRRAGHRGYERGPPSVSGWVCSSWASRAIAAVRAASARKVITTR